MSKRAPRSAPRRAALAIERLKGRSDSDKSSALFFLLGYLDGVLKDNRPPTKRDIANAIEFAAAQGDTTPNFLAELFR